ncbi:hypothetical protein UA70_30845, partial [Raoultella planticola]
MPPGYFVLLGRRGKELGFPLTAFDLTIVNILHILCVFSEAMRRAYKYRFIQHPGKLSFWLKRSDAC